MASFRCCLSLRLLRGAADPLCVLKGTLSDRCFPVDFDRAHIWRPLDAVSADVLILVSARLGGF